MRDEEKENRENERLLKQQEKQERKMMGEEEKQTRKAMRQPKQDKGQQGIAKFMAKQSAKR